MEHSITNVGIESITGLVCLLRSNCVFFFTVSLFIIDSASMPTNGLRHQSTDAITYRLLIGKTQTRERKWEKKRKRERERERERERQGDRNSVT